MLKFQYNSDSKTGLGRERKLFLCGASALAVMAVLPSYAQDADNAAVQTDEEDESDEIIVRGIRRSLQSAQDIKQNADTFVDAVTAEDIGALPDRSVTEALQRVPGVAISRFAAADDPDHFSIEGQGVVVRGLTYVRSELNGRDTFSANNGRALSFSDVPPELLGSVQVFKNQTADLIEGGIAGSINLVTRKPFDQDGHLIAGSAEYNYSDFRDQGAPTFSGLLSNRWETDIGEFGILVNGVFSELETRSDGTQISSFQPRDDLAAQRVWAPEGAVVRTQDYDRERIGYGGSAQWQNNDRTVLATFEFLRSEATTSWNEHVTEIATDNVGDTAFFFVPGTEFGFDENDLLTHGTISAPTGWRDDQFTPPPDGQRTPIYGLQSNNIFRGVEQENVTQDISFNLKWSPSERFRVNLDFQRIKSTVENTDFGIWGSTFQDVALDLRSDIPNITFLPPNEVPGFNPNSGIDVDCSGGTSNTCPNYLDPPHDSFADPFNSFWRSAMDHFEDSKGTENAFRADAEYDFEEDSSWLRSIRVGGRYAERDQTTRFSTYNWGALSEIWGNGGPVWLDEIGAPEGLVAGHEWENFHRGDVVMPPSFPYFTLNPAQNYEETADFADSVVAAWLSGGDPTGGAGGWRRLGERDGLVDGTVFLPGEIADVTEENWAGYVKFNYGFDDFLGSGLSLDGNFGVRYIHTNVTSVGAFQFPDAAADFPTNTGLPPISDPDNPDFPGGDNRCLAPIVDDMGAGTGTPQPGYTAPGFCNLSAQEQADILQFSNNGFESRSVNHDYDAWLPSFNAKLGIGEGKLIRFAYSRAIARADVGLLRSSFTINPLTQDDPRTPGPDPTPGGSGFFGFTTSGGNPFLNPIKSHNFDLSYEWYFADVGSLTISGFYKLIDDIIVGGQGDISFTNNGITVDNVFTRQPTNSPETGKIKGFEIAYQQFYDFLPNPFDGVGTQFTYTYIDSTGVPSAGVNPTTATPAANDALVDLAEFPLEGLSKHTINASVIYEKGPISTRLSYNWRSDYLVTARDVITPFYPIFQNSTGQLDGSFFYTINDNVKLGVQAANILNEITETESFIPDSDGRRGARSFFENDRRVTVSLRVNFN